MKKADKFGWFKMQNYGGQDRTGSYNFYRDTKNVDVTMWIKPIATFNNPEAKGCLVQKSTHIGDGEFDIKVITQFPSAKEAKEWVNKEFAHMFEGGEIDDL